MQTNKMGKRDFILIGALFIAGLIMLLIFISIKPAGNCVNVSVDGSFFGNYSLDENGEYLIEGVAGGTNHLVIKDGVAYVDEASCPDHLCMNMGRISKDGQSIICLPNKVVIEVVSENKSEIDVIAQ